VNEEMEKELELPPPIEPILNFASPVGSMATIVNRGG